jgi:hypothetical protein
MSIRTLIITLLRCSDIQICDLQCKEEEINTAGLPQELVDIIRLRPSNAKIFFCLGIKSLITEKKAALS